MRSVLESSARLVAFVFLFTVTSAAPRAEDTASARRPLEDGESGILILQDGGVLSGQITRAADWYMVARGAGQMQIAQSRVQLVCRTLEEAYEFRRKEIIGDKAADHLRLAEWCIRYDLRAEAGRELAEARRIDPDQPRLALLERRLVKGSSPRVVKESVYLAAANGAAKPPFDTFDKLRASKLRTDGQAAGNTPPVGGRIGDLPAGVIELFTRKVQPVLVNSCTTSGCHQSGSQQSFQLDRAILRGESNRRSTLHNLEATLALVDRVHPDQSPLLTVPRKTHGGTPAPVFGPRQEQALKHVVDWVALVAPQPEMKPAAATAMSGSDDAKAALRSVQPVAEPNRESAEASQPASRQQFALHADAATADDSSVTLRSPHRLQVGAQLLKSWQPRDEFDPKIFNRQQQARAGQANPPVTQTSTTEAATTAEER